MSEVEGTRTSREAAPSRWRLGLLVVAGVVPLLLLGLYAYRVGSRAVRDLAHSSNRSATTIASQLVAGEFERRVALARSFAAIPGLVEAVERRDEETVRSHLAVLVGSDERIVRAFVTDTAGLLWSDYPRAPESLGVNFSHRDWYAGLTRDWSPYVSRVYRRHADPQPLLVAIAVPVRDGRSRSPIGALVYQIRLEGLTRLTQRIEIGAKGYVFLLDHAGAVAAHPELDLQARVYGEYAELDPVREALSDRMVTSEYDDPFTNERVLAMLAPVPVQGRHWVAVAQQPVREAYAAVRSLRLQIGLAGGLITIFAVLVAVGLGRAHARTHRLNAALREAHDELETRVEERTAQLRESEKQLQHAQKMEAVGRLAGGVAHDFNNMLSVIVGYSDLLLSQLDDEDPLREQVDEIRAAGERASALTQQLLAFSRRQVRKPRVLDLNEIVQRMDRMLRRLIGEDIDLITHLGTDVWPVEADPSQVEQIFLNLAVNARDAMPDGGKLTVETENVVLDDAYVETHPEAQPGPHVMLAVSDTGEGMDEETRARIFEPFYTTKERSKGTGLGLSTVYGIVKQSGGNIWVYSEPGEGTTFKVHLPRAAGSPEPLESRPAPSKIRRGSGTVLVVEDESAVRELACRVLERAGYSTLAAADAEEAIAVANRHTGPIDLLLTDIVLPTMSGRELADQLLDARPETRVLYMSGYTDDAIIHRGVIESDTLFLDKPLRPGMLLEKVSEVLSHDDRHTTDG